MPYSLRSGNKLKRPARYRDESDDKVDSSTHPTSGNRDTDSQSQNDSLTDSMESASTANSTPPPSSFTPPAFSFTPPSPLFTHPTVVAPAATTNSSNLSNTSHPPPLQHPKMANTKIVKANPRRTDEHRETEPDDPPPAGNHTKNPNKISRRNRALALTPKFAFPKPAAFPSLPTDAPPPSQPESAATDQSSVHSMKELFEAIESQDQARVAAIKQSIDRMYRESENEWYAELRKRWSPDEVEEIVTFESLWYSVRNTIIEEIQADFTDIYHGSPFYPAQRILNLEMEKLVAIMKENMEVWTTEDEIPKYFQQYRRRHPDAIIDPDEPPPAEVVRAIRFLRQQSLPGSLLGEWHILPPVEVFRPPVMAEYPSKGPATVGKQ
ncbi:uncharacterized protein SETTUDRAFT_28548 [Exserohilum turcica Et28A]|uniref:Uncharacterized protein n=1 Tax=Exserohilum turcicum (strain 28A) TaxID=671987 RepID=R0IMC8_EXST2|nr:uncharacterized protein SETTUDRAFT_28548 [Exserohilum turcica Et28A]EOA86150.1 hypothetical protein SETTUDRAFT_28548 [Exserohilum turcica Et28A]